MFKRYCSCIFSFMLLTFLVNEISQAGQSSEATLLVVPSRQAIVKLAFNVARLRKDVVLVTYQIASGSELPLVYLWDAHGQDWVQTSITDYASSGIFAPVPDQVVIVGTDPEVLSVIERASSWSKHVRRVPSLSLMNIANALNEVLSFSASEWKYLARMHDLKLQDLNAERRRYGKYGKPGSKTTPVMPANSRLETSGSEDLVPVDVITRTGAAGRGAKSGSEEMLPEDK